MHRAAPAGFPHHHNLPADDRAIAQDTDPLLIERMPFPPHIRRLEDFEFFFWREM